jgi:aspartyl/asparaginyl-tRNA synthetase
MKKTFLCALFVVVALFLGQCSLGTTKIGDIKNNPRDYVDKKVTVSGTVTRTFSLLVIRYFTIQDRTGEIAVVTERPLPKEGQRIKVRGIVKDTFAIGSESLLVIRETPESEK